MDCIRELLAWGADRLQRDSSGYVSISFRLGNQKIIILILYLVINNNRWISSVELDFIKSHVIIFIYPFAFFSG